MKMPFKNPFLFALIVCLFQSLGLHAQAKTVDKNKAATVSKTSKPKAAKLTMTQTSNGKWVIMNSKKTTLYDVFIYDNGPDYAADGLIRVVKNGKIGYANAKTYRLVITPQYDCAFPFEKGKAKISNKCKTLKEGEHSSWESDAWQFVDKKGKLSAL